MSRKTRSEQIVEEFCHNRSIEWRRIKVAQTQGNRRPDYAIKVGDGWCILEVKELAPTSEDNILLDELRGGIVRARWVAPGKRLRGPIRSGADQLRKFVARKLPTVVCLVDTTTSFHVADFHVRSAMYGDETLHFEVVPSTGTGQFLSSMRGKNAMLRQNKGTEVSAVAVLRPSLTSEVIVDLYHNKFARTPIDPNVAASFVRRQIVLGADVEEHEGPTWFDVRDDSKCAGFWRGWEEFDRVVREILEGTAQTEKGCK